MKSSRTRMVLGAVVLAFVSARAVVACSSFDDASEVAPAEADAGAGGDAGTPAPDAQTPEGEDAGPPLPSFCKGLLVAASFDEGFVPELGSADPYRDGPVKIEPAGRFGRGASLVTGGTPVGASLFFGVSASGVPAVRIEEGTVAIWLQGLPPATGTPVVFRPTAATPPSLDRTGLFLAALQGTFGLLVGDENAGSVKVLTQPRAAIDPYFDPKGFNHVVAGWKRGDAGATGRLVVNGGLGKTFAAAPDSGPDDGGDRPFRSSSRTPWWATQQPVALRVGGPDASSLERVVDDLAVWDRMLEVGEIKALYEADVSIVQACRLAPR